MIGERLRRANEIAARRADRLARAEPEFTDQEIARAVPPSRQQPHRDAAHMDVAAFRKWNGRCGCSRCRELRAKRRKGDNKRRQAITASMLDESIDELLDQDRGEDSGFGPIVRERNSGPYGPRRIRKE